MSLPRRALPDSLARRGWCPGLARPMPTGDGLLARIHPPLGVLSLPQARAVAEGARRFGNGHIDVTARANLQVRGVREATRAPLARLLEAAGLGDARADGGPQRLTLTSPLAGRDPAEAVDVPGLARAIEAAGLGIPALPAKTLVAVEGRPGAALPDADVLVFAIGPGRVGIAVASDEGPVCLTDCDGQDAPAVVALLLSAFAKTGRRRARDLSEDERRALADGLSASFPHASPPPSAGEGGPRVSEGRERGGATVQDQTDGCDLSGCGAPLSPPAAQGTLSRRGGREDGGASRVHAPVPPAGLIPLAPALTALCVDAPFGRCTAEALDRLAAVAEDVGAAEIRLSPARGFVLLIAESAGGERHLPGLAADFVTAPDDPRRAVAACTGAPACASGTTPTLSDAARLADAFRPLAARGLSAHVSGCAKGCARPGPADLTLVGRDGLYDAVLGGIAGDASPLRLPIEAALERLGRAATLGLAAAFAPEAGGAASHSGRNRRPA